MTAFGDFVREVREALRKEDSRYSVRQVAGRIGVQPSYLSKVERGDVGPPSEATIVKLAEELGEDPDVMSALEGGEPLKGLKSVKELGEEKGDVPLPENESVAAENVKMLRHGLRKDQVREGKF